jgi:hypothetical protein
LIYLKNNSRKKNKNSSGNKIVSIANKNFKTLFSINPPSEPLKFQARKKQKSKRIVKMPTKGYFFQEKRSK